MNISRIRVDKLFNAINYDFSLKENVSILTAPNGCGKTTIMNLIRFIFEPSNKSFKEIEEIPFGFIALTMDDGTTIVLNKFKKASSKNKHQFFQGDYMLSVNEECLWYSDLYHRAYGVSNGCDYPSILANYIWICQKELLDRHGCYLEIEYIKPDMCYGVECEKAMEEAIENIADFIFHAPSTKQKDVILNDIICRSTGITNLDLRKMNSGGLRHWFLMFYNLVFKSNPSTLVMIDEPEMSLHICQQEKFMDEVIKLQKEFEMQVLIATHSPNIVNSHYDLIIEKENKT